MDREELAARTERLLDRYREEAATYDGITGPSGVTYSRQMADLLANWAQRWRDKPEGRHRAEQSSAYTDIIRRAEGEPDPLVKEPRRGDRN